MRKTSQRLTVLLSLCLSVFAAAAQNSRELCLSLVRRSRDAAMPVHELIWRNSLAMPTAREYPRAGRRAVMGDLKNLPEGRYVYLITADGALYFTPAIPDFDVNLEDSFQPVVASHRSLAKVIEADTSVPLLAVGAAGDFRIVSDLIDELGKTFVQ